MSVKIMSVKLLLISVNNMNKVRNNIGPFSGISDLRSVDNCLKISVHMTKLVAINQKQHLVTLKLMNNQALVICFQKH